MKRTINRMSFGKNDKRIDIFHLTKPQKNGIAGLIESKQFKDKIGMIVDDDLQTNYDADFACLVTSKNGIAPRIIMERRIFLGLKRGDAMSRFIIFHELGHYYNKDINESFNSEKYDAERINYVEQGSILKNEAAADDFAVEYLGRDTSIKGLNELYDQVISANENEMAATEITLRLRSLK